LALKGEHISFPSKDSLFKNILKQLKLKIKKDKRKEKNIKEKKKNAIKKKKRKEKKLNVKEKKKKKLKKKKSIVILCLNANLGVISLGQPSLENCAKQDWKSLLPAYPWESC
jgi:mannitol-specific phosphotransferase system IIBC component